MIFFSPLLLNNFARQKLPFNVYEQLDGQHEGIEVVEFYLWLCGLFVVRACGRAGARAFLVLDGPRVAIMSGRSRLVCSEKKTRASEAHSHNPR